MATVKDPEYNVEILNHVQHIDETQLDGILRRVDEFVRTYKKNLNQTNKDKELEDNTKEITSEVKKMYKSQKDFYKQQQESESVSRKESQNHSKNLEKAFEEMKKQNSDYEKFRREEFNTTQEKLTKQLDATLKGNSDFLSTQKKLQQQQQKIAKSEEKRTTQDAIKNLNFEHKTAKFQSEYYKKVREKIDALSGLKDYFKDYSKTQIALDFAGKALGKGFDTLIKIGLDTAKFLKDRLGSLVSNIFSVIGDIKSRTEDIAKSTGRDFETSGESLSEVNAYVLQFMKEGKAIGQDLQSAASDVAATMIKEYGSNWTKTMTEEQKRNALEMVATIKRYGGDPEEALRIGHGNIELQQQLLKQQAIDSKFRKEVDSKSLAIYDSMKMSWEQAEKNGYTIEQYMKYNKDVMKTSMKLSKNAYFTSEMASTLASARDELMSNTYLQNILSGKNVAAAQLGIGGVENLRALLEKGDVANVQKVLKELSSKNELREEAPALQELLETLNVAGKEWGMYAKHQMNATLTEEEEQMTELGGENTQYSSKKIAEFQTQAIMEAYLTARQKYPDKASEDILRQTIISNKLNSKFKLDNEKQQELSKNMTRWLKAIESGQQEEIEAAEKQAESLGLKEQFQTLKDDKFRDNALQLQKDLGKTTEFLNDLDDLGIADAVKKDGIKGILTGILDATMQGTFSPEKKKQLEKVLNNLGDNLKPMFNVVKQMLINPILNMLSDTIGGILGKIYAAVLGIGDKEEEKFEKEYAFQKRLIIDREGNEREVNRLDYEARDVLSADNLQNISDNFKKASKALKEKGSNAKWTDVEEIIKNNNLSDTEAFKIKAYYTALKRGSLGNVLSEDDIKDFENAIKGTSAEDISKTSAEKYNSIMSNINTVLSTGKSIDVYNDLLTPEESILFQNFQNSLNSAIKTKNNKENLLKILGLDPNNDNSLDFLALALAKSNSSLSIVKNSANGVINSANIIPRDNFNIEIKGNTLRDKPEYYEYGGVVEAKKGGRHAVLAEKGFDEIVIPTDPDKQSYAQKLLEIARDKYNVYLKDPENVSDKLAQYVTVLARSARMLMFQLDPLKDSTAYNYILQAFGMLGMIGRRRKMNTLAKEAEEVTGGGSPITGAPLENAPSMDAIRKAIIDKAISLTGTPYAEYPKGLVCNELINAAYGSVLGAKNYSELLHAAGYEHDIMHTISGFINEMGKNGDKGLIGKSLQYSDFTGKARPADLIFSANTGKGATTYNPDNHGHVNLYIDADNKIDSTSVNKAGVGIHKPKPGKYMGFNLLNILPESWYIEKGLIKKEYAGNRIIGHAFDLASKAAGMSIDRSTYNPALQSVPNASSVEQNVSRMNQAQIQREQIRSEKENVKSQKVMRKMMETVQLLLDKQQQQQAISAISVSPDQAFCSVAPHTRHAESFGCYSR